MSEQPFCRDAFVLLKKIPTTLLAHQCTVIRLEVKFLCALNWDLFVSSSLHARYYFALRSMPGEKNFRRCYDTIVQVTHYVHLRDSAAMIGSLPFF